MSWKQVKLSDAYWFQEGPGIRNWQFTTEGIKLLNVGNIMPDGTIDLTRTDRHISNEEFEGKYSHFGIDAGDLVIASSGISFDADGYLRTKVAFIEDEHLPLCLNTSTIRFKATEGVSDLNYLRHWINGPEFRKQVSQLVTGSAQLNFGPSHLKAMQISLPPLEEQTRIAGILDQADALRRLRARALEKLNTLGQAVFQEMFGEALETETLLHDWTEETLDQSIQYIDYRGKTPPKSEAGVRLVTAKNVRMGYVSPTPEEFIPAEQYEEWMSRGYPRNGDVVFTTEAPLGNVAILNEPAKFAVGQRIVTMRPNSSRLTSEYLMYFLRSQRFVKDMLANASGSTVRGIKTSLLKKIKIRYPSIHEQLHFSQCLQIAQSTLEQCEIAAQDSENLFASLQSAAFQGKL